ncbi:3-hydroxyacyl-CoA dehydrogenase NAD-binding domain-containing protein [Paenibacillus sp. GCM10027626]|uniref:3-hydroxyacyl-CoA dehydrogenase/enoyl-CoA hydratase family protein n=1 Tax=Paenibacillus sp. GCM10027626 TaxID=3273411 RepID=UPI00363EEDB1
MTASAPAAITKAAVIGSGVMGAAIAAHLANAGIATLLLDIVPQDAAANGETGAGPAARSRLAIQAKERLLRTSPAPLYDERLIGRITAGNVEDDIGRLAEADWIIEAVTEDLAIKHQVLALIEKHRRAEAVVSSNTSGISIQSMAGERTEAFRRHFLGIHFFNPPRYMKLVEMIPGRDTAPEVVQRMKQFCERRLGKGVVIAKDTPNFIANRIGTFGLLATLQVMEEQGCTVEEIDAVTGPALGRPKSATFRTLDLVGLDTFVHVVRNVSEPAFEPSKALLAMVASGWIGEKAGQGFYKKIKGERGSEILALNLQTMTYSKAQKPASASLTAAKSAKGSRAKVKALIGAGDRYSDLAWQLIKRTVVYAAEKVDEIAGSIEEVDAAMRWGFNWELGPFELWDAIGLAQSVKRMEAEGQRVPEWVAAWISAGNSSFYKQEEGRRFYVYEGRYKAAQSDPQLISLPALKEQKRIVRSNSGASLIDIGDGVACLEFHSPNNAIGADILAMIEQSTEEVRRHYDALVIANNGKHFCVGANLLLLLAEAQDEEWDEVDGIIRLFQNTMLRLKYFEKPVVAAPHQMTLGGGVEVCMPADLVCASAETYYGLVEAGVGLIPAGGGCKEIVMRMSQEHPHAETDLQPQLNRMFQQVGMAKVSGSAHEAKRLGYLRERDRIIVNADYRIYEAKQAALHLVHHGYEPQRSEPIRVVGAAGKAVLKLGALHMHQSGYISDHDLLIAGKLAHVMAGGDVPAGTMVTEQYMLDLEREAFLSLCGEVKTQQRMQHMLATGKPLRN